MEVAFPFMGQKNFSFDYDDYDDMMICKCISYKYVRKGAVVQHNYIML